MTIDWQRLSDNARTYASTEVRKDSSGQNVDVTAVGLRLLLSELNGHYPVSGRGTLTVYADTFVVDADTLPAQGTVIVARSVDLSAMPGRPAPLKMSRPVRDASVVEVLVGEVTGASRLEVTDPSGTATAEIPTGMQPLTAVTITVRDGGGLEAEATSDRAALDDLIGRPYGLNGLRAGFTGATRLFDADDADERSQAQSMLAWVATACQAVSADGVSSDPGDYASLYGQAAALLLDLNTEQGATFVPSLAGGFYQREITSLIDAVDSYEAHIDTLRTTSDISGAVLQVGSALEGVATTEIAPLKTQLQSIEQNIADLSVGIHMLCQQFQLQLIDCGTKLARLENAIVDKQIQEWFNLCFNLSLTAVSLGMDGAKLAVGDATALKDILPLIKSGIIDGAKAAKTLYDQAANMSKSVAPGQGKLLDRATDLASMQLQLMNAYVASVELFSGEPSDTPPTVFRVDPATAWDNYLAEANTQLDRQPMGAAATYQASLQVLANYGKAVSSKIAAATGQLAQHRIVQSQIAAAQGTLQQWKQLQTSSVGEQERLAGGIGMLQTRADALRRSVFVAWTHYRDAYYYLNFQKPPVTVHLNMSVPDLKTALTNAATWVAGALGNGSSKIHLPNSDVDISFSFDVVTAAGERSTERGQGDQKVGVNSTLYSPADKHSGRGPLLTWVIPMGCDQLKGVLPHGGGVAVWITKARFSADGVTPNSKGNVISTVSTSGSYENGFGPANAHVFAAKPMVGDFAYTVATGRVYDPWTIDTAVYMTPTPFTQWTMEFDADGGDPSTARTLRVDMTVSYLNP